MSIYLFRKYIYMYNSLSFVNNVAIGFRCKHVFYKYAIFFYFALTKTYIKLSSEIRLCQDNRPLR